MSNPPSAGRIVALVLLVAGCYRSPLDSPEVDETGSGVSGTGGAGSGGSSGEPSFGGAPGNGGAPSFGGTPSFGGAPSNGGAPSFGGTPSFGGAPSFGGTPSFGGAPGAGGAVDVGGAVGSGGTPTTLPSGNVVTFSAGSAQGAMTGPGWVALGAQDKIVDPTCSGIPITGAMPCMTSTTWNSSNALCATGYIPALPPFPVQSDYDSNWGVQICANATQMPGGTLGTTYRTIAIYLTGAPTNGLRLMVHRAGDPEATWYCATSFSGTQVALAALNTACWDGSGMALASADVRRIDKAGIQVPSTSTAITLSNLCMTRIVFGN